MYLGNPPGKIALVRLITILLGLFPVISVDCHVRVRIVNSGHIVGKLEPSYQPCLNLGDQLIVRDCCTVELGFD